MFCTVALAIFLFGNAKSLWKYILYVNHRLAHIVKSYEFESKFSMIAMCFQFKKKVIIAIFLFRNGPEWANLRKPVQDNLLRPKTVANYMPLIDGVANDFIKNIVGNTEITDLYYEMMLYTAESKLRGLGLCC